MEPCHFLNLSKVEKEHWYFAARRQFIEDLIYRYIWQKEQTRLKILDVGCGTGGTTNFLTRFGAVTGIEPSDVAIGLLKANYPHLNIIKASIENMDTLLSEGCFDLAILLGVLCHRDVKNPLNALRDICRKLKTGGWLIWHESAYPFLRHKNDELAQGVRRFFPSQMRRLLRESGFRIRFGTHVGAFIFPPAFILALLYKMKTKTENKNNPKEKSSFDRKVFPEHINTLLYCMTRLEMRCALNIFPMPIGISYVVMAQKI